MCVAVSPSPISDFNFDIIFILFCMLTFIHLFIICRLAERCIIFYLLFTMKTIKDVKERCSVLARDTSQCFHGTVIHYSFTFTTVKSKKKTIAYTSVANHLISLFSVSNVCVQQLTKRIFTILQRYSSLTKFVANNSALIETFLCEN